MLDNPESRLDATKAVLDLFATITDLPIGLFEKQGDELRSTFSTGSLSNFENHCKLIQSFPKGKEACDQDQCLRAEQAFDDHKPRLTCCHAGLWNQAIPIEVDEQVRAVLLFGEMLIADEISMQQTMENHQQTVDTFKLTSKDAEDLKASLLKVKKHSPKQIEDFRNKLLPIEAYLYSMIDHEQEIAHNLEKVVHELQTRLQAVIANSENIMMEASTLKPREVRDMANRLLSSAEALSVIVNNLGDFQQAYQFQSEKIRPLFVEAWRIYSAEADERYIKFRINLERFDGTEPQIDMSRQHLELAINNLMHNAIKYSFNGSANRERWVEVDGILEGVYYKISITNFGIGILPEEIRQGKIFSDGYQGHLTHGENRTGSGKGLTFVKRVVERHKGKIEVESTPKGNREEFYGQPYLNKFTIYLPLKHEKKEAEYG